MSTPRATTVLRSEREEEAEAEIGQGQGQGGAVTIADLRSGLRNATSGTTVEAGAHGSHGATATGSSTEAARQQTATAVSARQEFAAGLAQTFANFAALRDALEAEVQSLAAVVLDLPRLRAEFERLTTLQKALVVAGLLGALALLTYISWEVIVILWPKLVSFLMSEEGDRILTSCADALTQFNRTGAVDGFVALLGIGIGSQEANGDEMETNVTNEMGTNLVAAQRDVPMQSLVTIVSEFFKFYMSL